MNNINYNNISIIDNEVYCKKVKQNGRVNIINYNPYDKFKLYDRIKVDNKTTDYRNALQGTWCSNSVSDKYFSKENINLIQKIIIKKVLKYSNNKYNIGKQNEDALKMNMRNIYFQFSKNLPNNISAQVNELNEILTNKLVPEIISEATAYIKYKRDISTLAMPIDRPKSTYSNNTLEFKSFF